MPYIGHGVTNAGTFYVIDDLTMSSSLTYTLQVGGVSVTPKADNLLITLDGVIQHTPDAYTVSGSTITFDSAPGSGADFYGIIMGQSASTGQGSIGADELKVTGDGSANQFLAGDGDGTFTFKDGTLSTTTTTGDIIYRANSSALARLGIGSTGQVLTVANGVPAWSTDTEAYLPSAGGTMSGNIAMGGGNISGGGTITGTFVGGITGNVTGNADTATALATARAINGVDFDGSAAITVTADANTLSNTTLKSTVVTSSLTSVGTIGTGVWNGTAIASAYLDADTAHLSGSAFTGNVSVVNGVGGTAGVVTINNSSSDGLLELQRTTGSPSVEYVIGADSTRLYIRNNTDSNDIMTWLEGGNVGIGTTSPASPLHIYENTTATDSSAGLTIEQAGTGDAILQFLETGTQRWVMGLDNSDGDKFKISSDGDLNTNARLTIDTSGNATFAGNLTVDGTGTHSFDGMVQAKRGFQAGQALDIEGNTFGRTNSSSVAFGYRQDGSGNLMLLENSTGADMVTITNTGNATFDGSITSSGFACRLDQNSGTSMSLRNNDTGTSHYAEMYIGDSVSQLVLGYSNNYASGEWQGGWVYPNSGNLMLKSNDGAIELFSGGTGDEKRTLILDTSNNATFAGQVTATGIKFDANGEVLDDYEEGTGVPTVKIGATTCSLSSTNNYFYTKIGNKVFFSVEFRMGSHNSGSGEVTVGLPYTAKNSNYTAGAVRIYSGTVNGNEFSTVHSGSSVLAFRRNVNNSATANMAVPVNTYIYTSIFYETA